LSQNHENDENWLDDWSRFRLALAAMGSVVAAIGPSAPPSLGEGNDADVQRATAAVGAAIAAKVWSGVVEANHSIELGAGSLADHINSIARSDIGDDVLRRALPGIRHLFKMRLSPDEARFADQDFKEDDE
jgi:hypothetical protein